MTSWRVRMWWCGHFGIRGRSTLSNAYIRAFREAATCLRSQVMHSPTVGSGIVLGLCMACSAPRIPSVKPAASGLDTTAIAGLERRIERAQVAKDSAFLDSATDASLRFTHGGGTNVQSKDQWLRGILRGTMYDRRVSNQRVEVHGDIAVTSGQIQVRRPAPDSARANYTISYVRVYRCTVVTCKLLSHLTTRSTLLPSSSLAPPDER